MRERKKLYTPNQMKVLKQVFESVWDELEQAGRVSAKDQNMRQYVSGLVMAHRDYLAVDSIK